MSIVTTLFATVPMTASAYTGSYSNGMMYYKVWLGKIAITDCVDSASGSLNIPSTLVECHVTSIGNEVFSNCSSLKSIAIQNSVQVE